MIRSLLALLGPAERRRMVRFLVLAVVYAVAQGLAMASLVPILDALFAGDLARAGRWLAVLVVVVVVGAVAYFAQSMEAFRTAIATMRTMHHRLADHMVRLPIGWFDGRRVGEVSQIAVRGTFFVGGAAATLVTPVMVNSLSALTVVVVLAFVDWWLAVVLAVGGLAVAGLGRVAARWVADSEIATVAEEDELNARLVEVARCQPVLRACGVSGRRYAALDAALDAYARARRNAFRKSAVGVVLNGLTVQVVLTAAVAVGTWSAVTGVVEPAVAVAVVALAARFTGPLAEIAEAGSALRTAAEQLRRIDDILTADPMPEPPRSAPRTEPGRVVLDGVRFGYGDRTVLAGVDLVAEPGTTTALIGPSGSGKTTLCRLVARFHDVDAGSVRVGGADVREQTACDLMAQLSLVFQDVYLFDDTLWENVSAGRPGASEAEIREAARAAGVDRVAARLPGGFGTSVGEGGSRLSGGERQRVSIARALLKDAPIVLLDEATSALDTENERYVLDGLAELTRGRTVLVVAHKAVTVRRADRVVVLGADGTVVQEGPPAELASADGPYADFLAACRAASGWRIAAAEG